MRDPRLKRSVIYEGDLVKELSELPSLKLNGVSEELIQLIIDDYLYRKAELLSDGYIVSERNLGYTKLIRRNIAHNLQSKVSYTIKCVTLLNEKARSIVHSKFSKEDQDSIDLLFKLSNGNLELEDLK